jgi:hypothetical protein
MTKPIIPIVIGALIVWAMVLTKPLPPSDLPLKLCEIQKIC